MEKLINIVEESVNPLSSPLWPKKIVEKLIKGYEKGKPYYLQTRGWEKLWHGYNNLPCVIGQQEQQMSVDMGFTSDGTKKKPKHQYPTSFGMDIHKLVALVMVPNPDPENLREVDHVNDINCPYTVYYACALHKLFGGEESVGKLCWLPSNLRWRSSSDNGKDSRSEDHKKFEETVPLVNICQYFCNLPEEEKKEKTGFEIEQDLLEKNSNRMEWLGSEAEDQAYYDHLKDFVINYRNYSKADYRWMIHSLADGILSDKQLEELPDPILWDILRQQGFNHRVREINYDPNPSTTSNGIFPSEFTCTVVEKPEKIPDGKKGNWRAKPEWVV